MGHKRFFQSYDFHWLLASSATQVTTPVKWWYCNSLLSTRNRSLRCHFLNGCKYFQKGAKYLVCLVCFCVPHQDKMSEPTAKKLCKEDMYVCPLNRDIYIYIRWLLFSNCLQDQDFHFVAFCPYIQQWLCGKSVFSSGIQNKDT